ncbi:MAG: glycosyltransferase, partial [Cyclobacteriaceae bacterium]|nr:glycosyltransferase [Cyclobacteriaceae bacterium]
MNEVLFISSYPPRPCGIATYSQDLINAIHRKFSSFSVKVCALEDDDSERDYTDIVKYVLNVNKPYSYIKLAETINNDENIKMVFVQHEFGLYGGAYGEYLLLFLNYLQKPVSITFHSVLPNPDEKRKTIIQSITNVCDEIVVMTNLSLEILKNDYNIHEHKISIIPHGTHIVLWKNKQKIKKSHNLDDRLVLSTFGLMSSNKSIETALYALPKIVKKFPNVLYLVLGTTHPSVVKNEGEVYREFLETIVKEQGISKNVKFVNEYLRLSDLLEYLRLTDIYLFTSKDPQQAVSGTLSYAMSASCPVISTPIPHAMEMLKQDAGIIIDFQNSEQLADAVNLLLENKELRETMGRNAFHQTRAAVWENTAITHSKLFSKYFSKTNTLKYRMPVIHYEHIRSMTTDFGILQFSDICEPDIDSGYTLDDNARALIAICMHYNLIKSSNDLPLMETYLRFIDFCQQPDGRFLNYVGKDRKFLKGENLTNLEDTNGRTIWALGFIIYNEGVLPDKMIKMAKRIIDKIPEIENLNSPRAISFAIKGLYFYHQSGDQKSLEIINTLANKLLDKFNAVSDVNWKWYEDYLTYANSILPEAMLYAYLATKNPVY